MHIRLYLGAAILAIAMAGCASAFPSISTQPMDQTVTAGTTVKFSIVATGPYGFPLTYQWQRDGIAISGATSTSYTMVAMISDSGAHFTVIVTAGQGSVTSGAAKLTVTAAPVAPSI